MDIGTFTRPIKGCKRAVDTLVNMLIGHLQVFAHLNALTCVFDSFSSFFCTGGVLVREVFALSPSRGGPRPLRPLLLRPLKSEPGPRLGPRLPPWLACLEAVRPWSFLKSSMPTVLRL